MFHFDKVKVASAGNPFLGRLDKVAPAYVFWCCRGALGSLRYSAMPESHEFSGNKSVYRVSLGTESDNNTSTHLKDGQATDHLGSRKRPPRDHSVSIRMYVQHALIMDQPNKILPSCSCN